MGKWEKVRWSEVVEIKNGRNQRRVEDINGKYPIYGSGGVIGYANEYLCDEDTIIIGRKGNINRPIYVTEKFWNVDTAFGLCAKSKLLPKYLYYFCEKFNFEILNTTVTIPSLTKSNLLNIKMPLPPLEIQKQIADVLDTTSEVLTMRKQQLIELDNLIKSIFYDMFGDPGANEKGWEITTLAEIAEQKLAYGSGASAVEYDGKTRYIRITDINEYGSLNNNIVSPSEVSEKYYLSDGDILFARSGATVGKTLRFRDAFGQCVFAGYLIRFRANRALVLPDYIHCFTKTDYYRGFIEKCKKTVAQPNINAKQYGELKICIPPLSLQNQFADIVAKIEDQKALVKNAIDETQYLFDSLMSQYFD